MEWDERDYRPHRTGRGTGERNEQLAVELNLFFNRFDSSSPSPSNLPAYFGTSGDRQCRFTY